MLAAVSRWLPFWLAQRRDACSSLRLLWLLQSLALERRRSSHIFMLATCSFHKASSRHTSFQRQSDDTQTCPADTAQMSAALMHSRIFWSGYDQKK
jgi:hypothetical protein